PATDERLDKLCAFERLIGAGNYDRVPLPEIGALCGADVPADIASRALVVRGKIFEAAGDFGAAIGDYELAALREPNCARAYLGLGYVALKTQSHEEALAFLKRAAQSDQELGEAKFGMG